MGADQLLAVPTTCVKTDGSNSRAYMTEGGVGCGGEKNKKEGEENNGKKWKPTP